MDDVADFFCSLYDRLDEAELVNRAAQWRLRPTFKDRAAEVCAAVHDGEVIEAPSNQRDLFATLIGLDWAFMSINPRWTGRSVPDHLVPYRDRYHDTGSFTAPETGGALVPKLASPYTDDERPQRPDLAFQYVQRVSEENCRGVERTVIGAPRGVSQRHRAAGITIGCVPFIRRVDELDIDVVARDGKRHYRIRLKSAEPWAVARVDELVGELDAQGIELAVLPEMALTSDLLDHWRKRLDRDLPPGTRLRWVLAGTGDVKDSDPPTNTAVLLDAETGETLVEQSKQYRFDLKPAQQRGDYAFDGFGATEVLYEDIDVSRQLKLVDLGTIRLAILICEDLGSLGGLLGKVHGNGASHVLAPVFAKPTRYWRWEEQAAEVFARAQGTVTTVSNSLVLADLNDDDLPAPSSLVHTPYGFSVQRAAEPCDLMRYVVRDGHEPAPLDDEMPRPPA